MEKTNSDKELYYSFVKVLNNYLFKNYSKKFINSLKRWNIIKSSIKGNKAVAEVVVQLLVRPIPLFKIDQPGGGNVALSKPSDNCPKAKKVKTSQLNKSTVYYITTIDKSREHLFNLQK